MQTQKSSGFTLLEVLITVAVLSILVALAVPSFREMMDRNAVTTTANDILSSLLLARSEAIKREKSVQFTLSGASWTITDADGEELSNSLAPSGVDVGSISVTYNSRGRAPANSIEISKNGKVRCVIINSNGRPRVQKGSCP